MIITKVNMIKTTIHQANQYNNYEICLNKFQQRISPT